MAPKNKIPPTSRFLLIQIVSVAFAKNENQIPRILVPYPWVLSLQLLILFVKFHASNQKTLAALENKDK